MYAEEGDAETVGVERRGEPDPLARPPLEADRLDLDLPGGKMEVRADRGGRRAERLRGLGLGRPDERRPVPAQDAGLLAGDLPERVPQILLMIEADGRDQREDGVA